ncbi:MAG: hypothetical protein NT040_08730 [Bacteroidetes bacterium]|nr:hypothetical protein [Bacteroidota bacterium]
MNKPSAKNKIFDKTAIAVVMITGIFGLITIWVNRCIDGQMNDEAIKKQEKIVISPVNNVIVSSNPRNDSMVVSKDNPKSIKTEAKRKEPGQSNLSENTKPVPETSLNLTTQPKTYSSKVIDSLGKGIPDIEIFCPNCLFKTVSTGKDGSFVLQGNFAESTAIWVSELTFTYQQVTITKTIYWRDQSPQPIKFFVTNQSY